MKMKLFLTILTAALFFVSCSDDDAANANAPLGTYDHGFLVLNEGNFFGVNASVSYISKDFSQSQNNIFSIVNDNQLLGDVAQSIGFYDNLAYIVVNNSKKIEVVNRYTFKKVATIDQQIENPRYITFANGKGYLTNWGDPTNSEDDYVAIIDLATQKVTSTISVAEGPEQIVANNDRLYVSHSGGYNIGNTVSVISNDVFLTSINVGDFPDELEIIGNDLWVSCKGKPAYVATGPTKGKLVQIDLLSNTVAREIEFAEGSSLINIENTSLSNGNLYYNIGTDIYKVGLNATALPQTALFNVSAQNVTSIYGFAAYNDRIYISNVKGFTASGEVHVYANGDNGSTAGTILNTTTVGVGPSAFYFNF